MREFNSLKSKLSIYLSGLDYLIHLPYYIYKKSLILVFVFAASFVAQQTHAACTGSNYTWDAGAGNDNWTNATNWSSDIAPATTDSVTIIAATQDTQVDQNSTISCVEVVSGFLTDRGNRRLTVTGDYFRALTANTVQFDANTFWLDMGGTTAQTLEVVDRIDNLEIDNDSTVTFTENFEIVRDLVFAGGWTGTLNIEGDLFYRGAAGNTLTIPTGATVVIKNGSNVTTNVPWTVNGTLKIEAGSSLRIANNDTLTIAAGGALILNGASGNPAVIASSDFNDDFIFNMAGTMNANYAQFSRMAGAGINVTGTIQKLDNSEFHFGDLNDEYITLGATAALPATMTAVGFFNDNNVATLNNIDATAYTGTATTINDWSGSAGGAGSEVDPGGDINWGSAAPVYMTVVDNSNPPNARNQGTTDDYATFSFGLNQVATSTNITSIKITQIASASATDLSVVRVYKDQDGNENCTYNAATDRELTSGTPTLSGSPPSLTVSIPNPPDLDAITLSNDTDGRCIHVVATVANNAQDEKYIQFSIQATGDVVNSQGYSFSPSASPPVTASPATRINGDAQSIWEGAISTAFNTNTNWSGNTVPSNTRDCQIGVGQNVTLVDIAAAACQNANLLSGGTLDFNNTTNEFAAYGGMSVASGFNFNNATTGPAVLAMRGATAQNFEMETEFPGDVEIANTGGAGNETVGVNADSTVGGNLTITTGLLQVTEPNTLTVKGDLTCTTGATLQIDAGATLAMGNGSTLDIQSGCTFTLVGTSGNNAIVTSDAGGSYDVLVNGTIEARYYTFDHVGTAGVSIEAGATIDATNHLQDGTFSYPVGASGTMLFLKQQVPTNTMNNMVFSLNGSSATSTTNIDTTGAGAGTLTLDTYTGDLAGQSFDTDPTYNLSWLGATNTISITQEATSPGSLDAGSTYNMGRWGFQQDLAGASFNDTDITSLKVTLTGTATANDVSEVKLYYDDNCDGASGTLIGNGALSGNPASRTFSLSGGDATIEADVSTPPQRCLYVEYVIAGAATDGATAGAEISVNGDFVNSQSYAINSGTLPPINLGTPGTINGANLVLWTGITDTDWFTATNWSPNTVPTSSITCQIDDATNDPVINGGSGTAVCGSVIIGNGTVTLVNATAADWEIYGNFDNTGTINQNDGDIIFRDDGVTPVNQGINSSSAISAITFNKTAGGEVYINRTSQTINSITFPAGSDFDFRIPNGNTLVSPASITVVDATLDIDAGGTLEMANGTTVTVNAGGALEMVGSSGNLATMTTSGGTNNYNVIVNGEIQARYFNFDRLGTAGLSIESGATINTSDPLQNGEFTYPVGASGTMLFLKRKVPTDTINSIKFDLAGSAATSTTNIDTNTAAAGTLTINSYTGDLAGPTNDNPGTYSIVWNGAVNTIDLTQDNSVGGGVTAGVTELMGRFGFEQTLAGASYNDADLTSLRLTMTGTATAADLDNVHIYYDSDCDSAGGTLIGSGPMTGSPATRTFTLTSGQATVQADVATPPTRCIYVEYELAPGAVGGNTIGVEISSDSHVSNDQGYAIADATPAPVNLGTPRTITGASATTWTGATNTSWNTAGNWSAGVPTSGVNCTIPDVANDPVVDVATAACNQVTIASGAVLDLNGNDLEVHANFDNSGSVTYGVGSLVMAGSGANSITSGSLISTLAFNKTAGTVSIAGPVVQVSTLDTATNDSTFTLEVSNGNILRLAGSTTIGSGSNVKTLDIAPGGTLEMADGTTLTINNNGVLEMIGTSGNYARMTSSGAADEFNVVINTGEISANYFRMDHMSTAGLNIASGATINATNHLQNCDFRYPVSNSSTFVTLNIAVPSNNMDGCNFDLDGSSATGTTNIDTTGVGTSATLTIDSFTGDLSGDSFDNPGGTYLISWTGALNTIDLTQDASGPTSVDAGSTYVMGRFGFEQTQAGASYVDTDITSLKLTLQGTVVASDIDDMRIFYDSDCNSSAGTEIGSGTPSGSPLAITYSLSAADATIEADVATPPKRCIYVEVDFAAGAINNNTIGIKINASGDVVNDQTYAIAAGTPPPVNLGANATIVGATTTNWTGTTDTDWFTASNWSDGIPNSGVTCNISDVTNDPNINGGTGTAICKNVNNTGGVITLQNATGAVLEVHGNYSNTGTVNQNDGTIRFEDGGTGSAQSFSSTSTTSALTFDKTTGGSVTVSSSSTITTLTIPGGSNFDFVVPSGTTLTLPNGVTIPAGTFDVQAGGTVEVGNGQSISVTGGTFEVNGTNDPVPQNAASKGVVTVSGAGEWGFSASSGNVRLVGFQLRYLDEAGVNLSGSVNLTALGGGQFTELKQDFVTPVRAIQINTTGTVPATATNIGWMWGPANENNSTSCCAPNTSDNYYLVYAPNCSSSTITFDQWFGDFAPTANEPNTEDKIFDTDDGQTCQISIAAAASPIQLSNLDATPYNGEVSVDWETGMEVDHKGFNVYRSSMPYSGYVQINEELVKNIFTSTTSKGIYRFVDRHADNDVTYYYKIQDVSYFGEVKYHGPVSATPKSGLGSAPPDSLSENYGESAPGAGTGNDPTVGPIVNNDLIDLGHGVHVLAQTNNSLRIEIDPPAAVWSDHPLDASYKQLEVPGYSLDPDSGQPGLVERTLLIEVEDYHSTVSLIDDYIDLDAAINLEDGGLNPQPLAPSPTWTLDGSNVLQPSLVEDSAAYSTAGFQPFAYFELNSNIRKIGNKSYVELKVRPFLYNALSVQAQGADLIVLDLSLDGEPAWSPETPDDVLNDSPAAVAGTLRIKYSSTGMYQVNFDDIESAGLDGPFAGVDIADLRLFKNGEEMAIKTNKSSGAFGTGDYIRFFGVYEPGYEELLDEVVLAASDIQNSGGSALRMSTLDGDSSDPELETNNEEGTKAISLYEWNDEEYFAIPIGSNIDRFFMPQLFASRSTPNNPYPAYTYHDLPVELPNLMQEAQQDVTVKVRLVARTQYALNGTHHLGLYVNNIPYMVDAKTYVGNGLHEVLFTLPHSYFLAGTNNIRVRVLGDMLPIHPSGDDWEIVNLDQVEVIYRARRTAISDEAIVYNRQPDTILTLKEFSTSNVTVFDVTDNNDIKVIDNVSVSAGVVGFDAEFKANWVEGSEDVESGQQFFALEDGAYRQPSAFEMGKGYPYSLKGNIAGADLIVVGARELLDAATDLISLRKSEGMRVAEVTLDQIYAEFSHGKVSSRAIKDFVNYAYDNWREPKPKYLLILGDSTFDPKNYKGFNPSEHTMPVVISEGLYEDYANDNWYVTTDDSSLPFMAVGRLPSSDYDEVYEYVQKLVRYEQGEVSPLDADALDMVFVSDTSSKNENFDVQSNELIDTYEGVRSGFKFSSINRETAASDAAANLEIIDKFDEGPLMINYMGHGGETEWAGGAFFGISHAGTLDNSRLPIVSALNCYNTKYAHMNPALVSLGEELVFNPDGGAIAFWGSTTQTIPPVQLALAKEFANEMANKTKAFSNRNSSRLGDMILMAKVRVGDNPSTVDALGSYTLFGDPSMKLPAASFDPDPVVVDDEPVVKKRRPASGGGGGGGGCGTIAVPPVDGGGFGGFGGPFGLLVGLMLFTLPLLVVGRLRRRVS